MKRVTFRTLSRWGTIIVFTFLLTSCQDKSTSPVESPITGGALTKVVEENFTYLVGVGGFPENRTAASKGDTIIMSGSGNLSIHAKSVDGGGTYTQKTASGSTFVGFWAATQLISFKSYGTSEGFPSNFEGGNASLRVHLSPGLDGSSGTDGILDFQCLVGTPPPSAVEGIQLVVRGGANFADILSGSTLFIRQP